MMTTVSLVLDPQFRNRLESLLATSVVWICASPENDLAAKAAWLKIAEGLEQPHEPDRLTVFQLGPKSEKSHACIGWLFSIEEHSRWDRLNVYGAQLTDELQDVLSIDFGAIEINSTPFGFTARRGILTAARYQG